MRVEFDLATVSTDVLLDELSDRGEGARADDLDRAGDYFVRGDTAEALIWLERALPDRFAGLAARAASFHGGRS